MKENEIFIDDWMRILIGNVPVIFFIEVTFRVLFVFVLLLFSMRMMGKRMSSQLSRNEMVAMSSLAAAIGIPIQSPDRGLLPGFIVAMIVILGQRLIATIATRSERFEEKSQGEIGNLVYEGRMNLKEMVSSRISRERLFAQLRKEGIKHLGQVGRFYFEANGTFTVVNRNETKPGLSVLPEEDNAFVQKLQVIDSDKVCYNCGNAEIKKDCCTNCGKKKFVHPVSLHLA